MSWIETIKVQTSGRKTDRDCLDYLTALEQEIAGTLDATIRSYTHAAFPEQHMVWLKWHSTCPGISQSHLSEVVIHELKQFGLVDHSAWILPDPKNETRKKDSNDVAT